MMIDERLDEQLVEQFPSVPLTDERRVKIKSSPFVAVTPSDRVC